MGFGVYLVFDFCGERLVDDIIPDQPQYRPAQAKRVLIQYLTALQALTKHEVYFEMMRTDNLRFTHNEATLNILEIPFVVDSAEEQLASQINTEWSSPETCKGEVYTPEKAMVWTAGILLYRLLYKSYPFGGKTILN